MENAIEAEAYLGSKLKCGSADHCRAALALSGTRVQFSSKTLLWHLQNLKTLEI